MNANSKAGRGPSDLYTALPTFTHIDTSLPHLHDVSSHQSKRHHFSDKHRSNYRHHRHHSHHHRRHHVRDTISAVHTQLPTFRTDERVQELSATDRGENLNSGTVTQTYHSFSNKDSTLLSQDKMFRSNEVARETERSKNSER